MNTQAGLPARSSKRDRRLPQFVLESFLILIGFLSSVVIHLVGDLFVSEVCIVAAIPFLAVFYIRRLGRPALLRLFLLLGLWLLAQIVSDAYNHSALKDQMRGMAAILFFTAEIAFFAILVGKDERRKALFLVGYACGSIVMARLTPPEFMRGADIPNQWKWGYAHGVTCLALLVSSWLIMRRRSALALGLLAVISGIDLLTNFRSAFLILSVSIVLVFPFIPEQIGRLRILPRNHGFARIAAVAILALAGGWSASKLVHYVSQAGLINEKSLEKNESEAQAGNLLVGGRPEFFVGLRAAMDRPIIGHGSWAREMKYVELQHDMMREYGIEHDLADVEASAQGLIPSHSHVVGAWVSAGLFGAVFWCYLFWLVLRGIVAAAVLRPVLTPVYLWLFITYTWNIFFSPFGSTSRVIEAFTIVVIVDLLNQHPIRAGKRTPWRRQGAAAASRLAPLQIR